MRANKKVLIIDLVLFVSLRRIQFCSFKTGELGNFFKMNDEVEDRENL